MLYCILFYNLFFSPKKCFLDVLVYVDLVYYVKEFLIYDHTIVSLYLQYRNRPLDCFQIFTITDIAAANMGKVSADKMIKFVFLFFHCRVYLKIN